MGGGVGVLGSGGDATVWAGAGSLFGDILVRRLPLGALSDMPSAGPKAAGVRGQVLERAHSGAVHGIAWAQREGTVMASCGDDRRVVLWRAGDAAEDDEVSVELVWARFAHRDRAWRVAFWSGGVLSSSQDSTVAVLGWGGDLRCRVRAHGYRSVWAVASIPSAAVSADLAPAAVAASSASAMAASAEHTSGHGGETLVTGGNDGCLLLHDLGSLIAQTGSLGPAGTNHHFSASSGYLRNVAIDGPELSDADATPASPCVTEIFLHPRSRDHSSSAQIAAADKPRSVAPVVGLGLSACATTGLAVLEDGSCFAVDVASRASTELPGLSAVVEGCSFAERTVGRLVECVVDWQASGLVLALDVTGHLTVLEIRHGQAADASSSAHQRAAVALIAVWQSKLSQPGSLALHVVEAEGPEGRCTVAVSSGSTLRVVELHRPERDTANAVSAASVPCWTGQLVQQLQLQRQGKVDSVARYDGPPEGYLAASAGYTVQFWPSPGNGAVRPTLLENLLASSCEPSVLLPTDARVTHCIKAWKAWAKTASKRSGVSTAGLGIAAIAPPQPASWLRGVAMASCASFDGPAVFAAHEVRLLPAIVVREQCRFPQIIAAANGDLVVFGSGQSARVLRLVPKSPRRHTLDTTAPAPAPTPGPSPAVAAGEVAATATAGRGKSGRGIANVVTTCVFPASPRAQLKWQAESTAQLGTGHDGFCAFCELASGEIPTQASTELLVTAQEVLKELKNLGATECGIMQLPWSRSARSSPHLAECTVRCVESISMPSVNCIAGAACAEDACTTPAHPFASPARVECCWTLQASILELWVSPTTGVHPIRRLALDDGNRRCRAIATVGSVAGAVSGTIAGRFPLSRGYESAVVMLSPGLRSKELPCGALARLVVSTPPMGNAGKLTAHPGEQSAIPAHCHGGVGVGACSVPGQWEAAGGGVVCTIGEDQNACLWRLPSTNAAGPGIKGRLELLHRWSPTHEGVRSVAAAMACADVAVLVFGGVDGSVTLFGVHAAPDGPGRPVLINTLHVADTGGATGISASAAGSSVHDDDDEALGRQRCTSVTVDAVSTPAMPNGILVTACTSGGVVAAWIVDLDTLCAVSKATTAESELFEQLPPILASAMVQGPHSGWLLATGHTDGCLRFVRGPDADALAPGSSELCWESRSLELVPVLLRDAAEPCASVKASSMGVNAISCCMQRGEPVICVAGDDESVSVVRLEAPTDIWTGPVHVNNVSWVPAVGGAAVRDIWCGAEVGVVAASVDERVHIWRWCDGDSSSLHHRPPPTGLAECLDHGGVELSGSRDSGRSPLADSAAAAEQAGIRLVGQQRHTVCDVGGLAVMKQSSAVLSVVVNGHGLETVRIEL